MRSNEFFCNQVKLTSSRDGAAELTRAEPWPVVMADGVDDTAVAPVAAAALASLLAAAVLAPHAPSPPPSLLLHPPSTPDDDTPLLDGDVQLLIQDMVRHRVKQNWPFVRAFECRTSSEATASFPLNSEGWRMGHLLVIGSR